MIKLWEDYVKSIPFEELKSREHVYGELTKIGTMNPVSNLSKPYYYFKDTHKLSPAAEQYKRIEKETGKGEYCPYIPGTQMYVEWWEEEKRRCEEGYTANGITITGEHYFYLNYCIIERVIDEETGDTALDFPRFLSMDYYWFWELYEAENPKHAKDKKHLIAAKARRKGFSFKNAAGCVYKFTFSRQTKTVIASQKGEKARNTFEMALKIIDFLNETTEFSTPLLIRKISDNGCRVVAGAKIKSKGREYTKGRMTEIMTVSMHNSPDAAAGLGAVRVIFEEAGMMKDLKKAWEFTEPTLRSGAIKKGIGIIYGTGGDMEGSTRDFSEMFQNPEGYNLAGFDNIYEYEHMEGKCGLFFDDLWFREGDWIEIEGIKYPAVDKDGNANRWVADLQLNVKRAERLGGDKKSYNTFLTQHCKTPSEAFLITEGNVFPTGEVLARINTVRQNTVNMKPYVKGSLIEVEGGTVKFVPDLEEKLTPMDYFPLTGKETMSKLKGCVIQYFAPEKVNNEIPEDAYIIGLDPYAVEGSIKVDTDTSLGCAYVKRTKSYWKEMGNADMIVASYIGREERSDDFLYNVYKLAKYYNAKIMFENDRGNVKQYFQRKKSLNMLCNTPGHVIEKHIPNSSTLNRKKGYSMSSASFKEDAILYVIDWLLEPRIEGEGMRNLDTILDIGLLQEMLVFNFKYGNYDRIMALVGCILYDEQVKLFKKKSRQQKSFWTTNSSLFNLNKLVNNGRTPQNFSQRENEKRLSMGEGFP